MAALARIVAAAISREADRLATDARTPEVAALLRYACRNASRAAVVALTLHDDRRGP